jgi:predicted nucleotidyltransferase
METVLKNGYEKILNIFYKEKNGKIHLREISRRIKMNENSATRFLKQLEEQDILKSEREGNLKKYFIQKKIQIFWIFSLFDIRKYNSLPNIRKNAITQFIDRLEEKPLIVLLFGSTVKKTFVSSSDVDLMLVVNRKIKTEHAETYAESQTGIRINSFQLTHKNFQEEIKLKKDTLVQSAISTGYPIINHLSYYEIILK